MEKKNKFIRDVATCRPYIKPKGIKSRRLWFQQPTPPKTRSQTIHIFVRQNAGRRNISKLFLKQVSFYLTFRGLCIVIYSYNKTLRDALISHIYFRTRTLHFSDSSSVHHQLSTVHTAIVICHTGYADCLLVESGNKQSAKPE